MYGRENKVYYLGFKDEETDLKEGIDSLEFTKKTEESIAQVSEKSYWPICSLWTKINLSSM